MFICCVLGLVSVLEKRAILNGVSMLFLGYLSFHFLLVTLNSLT